MKSVLYFDDFSYNDPSFPVKVMRSSIINVRIKPLKPGRFQLTNSETPAPQETDAQFEKNDLYLAHGLVELAKSNGNAVYESDAVPDKSEGLIRNILAQHNIELDLLPEQIDEKLARFFPDPVIFHAHPSMEITHVTEGDVLYITDKAIHHVEKGEIIIFNGFVPHAWLKKTRHEAKVREISFLPREVIFKNEKKGRTDFLFYFVNSDFKFIHIRRTDKIHEVLSGLLEEIEREYHMKQLAYENIIQVKLTECFTHIARFKSALNTQPHKINPHINDLLLYIDRNISENITLKKAAEMCFLSPQYFSTMFKNIMGVNFSYYINKLRVEKAQKLLQETDLTILDIAMQCGFNSLSNFYRTWDSFNNIRPTKIRDITDSYKTLLIRHFVVDIEPDEYWWGGCARDGSSMPYDRDTALKRRMDPNSSPNQACPFLVSSHGRYIWCEDGFDFQIDEGKITITHKKSTPVLYSGGGSLKEAFLAAAAKHFPPSLKTPHPMMFTHPQYNTWIDMVHNQNQEGVLSYARGVIENGMAPGVFMIDSGWQRYFGCWQFEAAAFPEPKAMVDELHRLGFSVMLWVCPFVCPSSREYHWAKDRGMLILNRDRTPAIREWWEGYSAILDFTNPDTIAWFDGLLSRLMTEYGVDGFKFDGGDAYYYNDDDISYAKTDANGQSSAFVKFGLRYRLNEFRASFKMGGQPAAQRLCDKKHSWDTLNGVGSLVPCVLAQGIIGHPYACPDMIGGGEYSHFYLNRENLSGELFVRHAECAALMPMMQFSAPPWRFLSAPHAELCRKMMKKHIQYAPVIMRLVEEARITGQPIVRYMEYEFPHQGYEKINDQYMLGDAVLVAPVTLPGAVSRQVALPPGVWEFEGRGFQGGRVVEVSAPLGTLPVFIRADRKDRLP